MKQVLNTSLAILIIGVFCIAGCYSPQTENKAVKTLTGATGKPVVAIIPGAESPEFLQLVRAGAEAAGRELGFDIGWNPARDKNSISAQYKHVYDVVEKKPAGIVLSPLHRVRLLSAVNKSSKVRVPISLLDNNVDTNFRLSLIGPDHRQAGVLAAQRIGEITGGSGKVGLFTGASTAASTEERALGFEETVAAEYSGIQLVKLDAKFSNIDELKAIFAVDESSTLQLVLTAVPHTAKLVGSGASRALVTALRQGAVDALLVSNPYKMGYESVKAIAEYRDNRRPQKRIDTGIKLVTKANMNAPENRNLLVQQEPGVLRR